MSQFNLCSGPSCNNKKPSDMAESHITPRRAYEQFSSQRPNRKQSSNNASNELTESRENKRKVSIRQSMEEKNSAKMRPEVYGSRMSELKKCELDDDDQDLRHLLKSLKSRH